MFYQDVKEPKKRGRETEKKDVAKKDDGEAPAKRGRGRPPKSGSTAKKDKPKVLDTLVLYKKNQFL